MISLDEVESSILELEQKDTCFATCEKLAQLYIVRDHLKDHTPGQKKGPLQVNGSSEFLQAVNGKDSDVVFDILNELMQGVKMISPSMYERTISAINKFS